MQAKDCIRVFTRRTSYTPDDEMTFIGEPPLGMPKAKSVHISCCFTWDKSRCEQLAESWRRFYEDVRLNGPAYDNRGGEFVPGLYLKQGEVITSRGCPNHCLHCFVPKREGGLRLLSIQDGWDVLDNNLLACPREHIVAVIDMLKRQKYKAMFRGGLEAARIDDWFIEQLARLRVQSLFLAYDSKADTDPCREAIGKLRESGYNNRQICCYVLCAYGDDTPDKAILRLQAVKQWGAMPFAMYFRGETNQRPTPPPEWQKIVRPFSRPRAIFANPNENPPASIESGQGLFQGVHNGI